MLSLYRKYRPRAFGELVGQEAVVTALTNALTSGSTVHAYLFAGPRGSGKTSLARLLAKALNCPNRGKGGEAGQAFREADPCNECEICRACDDGRLLDLIEIDAASNRGIDNMRDIRQQVAYAPSLAKRKVYIIDEVHMLSKDAANAFLKTLEEPPPFVVFILATTEVHKLLPTVVSRCQRFEFKKVEFAASLKRIQEVANWEKLDITEEALSFIVSRGDGSLRDMLGLLEQVVTFGSRETKLDRGHCLKALGMIGDEELYALVEASRTTDPSQVVLLLDRCSREGIDASVLAFQLLEHCRRLLWISSGNRELLAPGMAQEWLERNATQASNLGMTGLLRLLERISEAAASLRNATLPYFTLELALLRGQGVDQSDIKARLARLEEALWSGATVVPTPAPQPMPAHQTTTAPRPTPAKATTATPVSQQRPQEQQKAQSSLSQGAPPPPVQTPSKPAPIPVESKAKKAEAEAASDDELFEQIPEPALEEENLGSEIAPPNPSDPPTTESVSAAWEKVMGRIRAASLRTHALLKDVVRKELTGSPKKSRQLALVLQKGHRFAVERLREEIHIALIRDAIEKELGIKLTVVVDEDNDPLQKDSPGGATRPSPEKGWAEKQAVQAKGVQAVLTNLEGEVIRTE